MCSVVDLDDSYTHLFIEFYHCVFWVCLDLNSMYLHVELCLFTVQGNVTKYTFGIEQMQPKQTFFFSISFFFFYDAYMLWGVLQVQVWTCKMMVAIRFVNNLQNLFYRVDGSWKICVLYRLQMRGIVGFWRFSLLFFVFDISDLLLAFYGYFFWVLWSKWVFDMSHSSLSQR